MLEDRVLSFTIIKKQAAHIVKKISVSRFKSNTIFKRELSRSLEENTNKIDEAFGGNDDPLGKNLPIMIQLSITGKNNVEGLTLGPGASFVKEGRMYKNLVVILRKTNMSPPRFKIETAYPSFE